MPPSQEAIDRVLSGGGQMGALMRSIDWSATALGPVHTWPHVDARRAGRSGGGWMGMPPPRRDSPVRVSTTGDGDAVAISIHNAGAPIPAAVQQHIFEPFQRGHPADPTTRSVGLGLYIVKQIVGAHRGTIDMHSTEADGTTFTVRLPRKAV